MSTSKFIAIKLFLLSLSIIHDLWCWTTSGIQRSGEQRSTLGQSLENEATSLRATLNQLWSLAQDRSSWRSTIAALCTPRRRGI